MSQDQTAQPPHGSAVATPATAPPKVDRLPPFRVLLHNDDVHTVPHVIESIVRTTPLDAVRAARVTLEAHVRGVSLVLVTHRELAELYQERLASRGLTVTLEAAS
jgi:ATP-dependent Clp protease adaptor protein ClpS